MNLDDNKERIVILTRVIACQEHLSTFYKQSNNEICRLFTHFMLVFVTFVTFK